MQVVVIVVVIVVDVDAVDVCSRLRVCWMPREGKIGKKHT